MKDFAVSRDEASDAVVVSELRADKRVRAALGDARTRVVDHRRGVVVHRRDRECEARAGEHVALAVVDVKVEAVGDGVAVVVDVDYAAGVDSHVFTERALKRGVRAK